MPVIPNLVMDEHHRYLGGPKPRELFTVEYEDGEMIDASGDGGFSVFLDRESAQDCLDTSSDSHPEDPPLRICRYVLKDGL